jgi:hypothetical protein
MSFYTAIESQPSMNQLVHLPKSVRTKTAESGTIEHKIALPPMNYFGGLQRLKPQSSFSPTSLFQAGSQLDFYLQYNGFLEQVRLQMDLQVNPAAANPLSICGPYLLDRVEIYDSNQNIMQTVYADSIFLQRLWYGKDKSAVENSSEGVSTSFGSIGPLAANTRLQLNLCIPSAISDSQLKGNVTERLLFRVYFSSDGITSGLNTDLFCNQCDIIQHAQQLSGQLESMEICKKRQSKYHFRVLNPIRVASYVIANAVANQQYDVILTSATQMSAFLYFIVRATPTTSANVLTYIPGITFELYDSGMTLVGVTQTPENNRWVVSQKFGGDIFNAGIGAGIYVLPFAIDVQKALKGSQTGFYKMTTRETLRLYMPAGLVTGNYIVECYSMDYAELVSQNGKLIFNK